MPLIISDEDLKKANLSEREARVELACRLYDVGRLALWPAAKLAGLNRGDFENELIARQIPIYRPTWDDIERDLTALDDVREHP